MTQRTRIKRKSNDNLKGSNNFILYEILIVFLRYIYVYIYIYIY